MGVLLFRTLRTPAIPSQPVQSANFGAFPLRAAAAASPQPPTTPHASVQEQDPISARHVLSKESL